MAPPLSFPPPPPLLDTSLRMGTVAGAKDPRFGGTCDELLRPQLSPAWCGWARGRRRVGRGDAAGDGEWGATPRGTGSVLFLTVADRG